MFARTNLLLIGGGTHPEGVIDRFVQYAGGSQARILVITWATEYPDDAFQSITEVIKKSPGAETIQAPSPPISQEFRNDFLEKLKQSSGIYFTGGDQNKIMQVLTDDLIRHSIIKFYQDGNIVAGTSAGTAIMSSRMMTGNGYETAQGLGLLPDVILDTHFIVRNRLGRLQSALLLYPHLVGLGIDEDNAIWVQDEKFVEIIGPTYLTKVANKIVFKLTEDFEL